MGRPTTPTPDPGERRPGPGGGGGRLPLERPPGERYVAPARAGGDDGEVPSRPVPTPAVAATIALAGSALIVVLGGVLSLSAGLLVVTGVIGWLIGQSITATPEPLARARRLAPMALAVGSVVVGQVGLWLYALSQGGALGLVDYLAQTWGPLIPAQLAAAALAAWLASR
jgi:hypothetical protein